MAVDPFGRMQAMLRRRGVALPQQPDADALAAIERCVKCNYTRLCDEFLASPAAGGGSSVFCPNSHYIQALRYRRLEFTGT